MTTRHTLAYFAAKLAAALVGTASILVYTRLLSPAEYGFYVLATSVAFVVHAFAIRWLLASYFQFYRAADRVAQTATFVRLCGLGCGMLALMLGGLAMGGGIAFGWALALAAMLAGLTVFEGTLILAQVRLEAGLGSIALVLRAVMALVLGATAISSLGTPAALVGAVGLANIAAGLPILFRVRAFARGPANRELARAYVRYGWPLAFSTGIVFLGQYAERFLLAGIVPLGDIGRYGAMGDIVRQGLIMPAEAVTMSTFSLAKRASADADDESAARSIRAAFVALVLVVTLGGAFVAMVGPAILEMLLGPGFRDGARVLAPLLALGYGLLVLRVSFFGQAIYFGCPPRADLVSAVTVLAVTAATTLLAAPHIGVAGGALAIILGQLGGCAVLVHACRHAPLPVDWRAAGIIVATSLVCAGLAVLIAAAASPLLEIGLQTLVFLAAGLGLVWTLDVIGIRATILASSRMRAEETRPP